MRKIDVHWQKIYNSEGAIIEGYEVVITIKNDIDAYITQLQLSEAAAGALSNELTKTLQISLRER